MIPDHQTLMRPLLECIQDGQEHIFKNIVVKLADRFELSPEEREQLQPSGRYPLFSGRVGWAKTYMKKAGLLEQKKRGYLSITPLGTTALKSEDRIDTAYLTRYPAFVRFQAGAPHNEKTENAQPVPAIDAGCTSAVTPEETIAHAYEQIHNKLSSELLDAVLMQDFAFFERLVVELLVKMGYGGSIKDAGRQSAVRATKESTASSKKTSWDWTSFMSKQRNGAETIPSDAPNCINSWAHSPDKEVRKGSSLRHPLLPKRPNPTNPKASNWSKSTEKNWHNS